MRRKYKRPAGTRSSFRGRPWGDALKARDLVASSTAGPNSPATYVSRSAGIVDLQAAPIIFKIARNRLDFTWFGLESRSKMQRRRFYVDAQMSKRRIFTVGFPLPGDDFEYIDFDSDATLLDADIVLFQPTLGSVSSHENYNGEKLLDQESSFKVNARLAHWRSEIVAAVNAGKMVVIYLVKPSDCYRYTGDRQFSGTGRSRVTTNVVTRVSSYDAVPNLKSVKAKSGTEICLEKGAGFLAAYWSEFSECSPYEVEIEVDSKHVVLKSRTGDRSVGAAVRGQKGVLLFLPPLHYDEDDFVVEDEHSGESNWTEEAERYGKRLISALVGLANTLAQSGNATPAPPWAADSRFRLALESDLESAISACSTSIGELQERKASLGSDLTRAGGLRGLLYEQGKPLEAAIIEALRLFGFEAKPFSDGDSEFDCVFVSPEGRCLGEAEGKDSRAINIEKFSQLERNLQEDFARDEVTEYAKGVLFGNAFRLQVPQERADCFTEKCISAAKRIKAALVRTNDLFSPARYLKENPSDSDYAKQCREAIFRTEGDIVVFPALPATEATVLQERAPSGAGRPDVGVHAGTPPANGSET